MTLRGTVARTIASTGLPGASRVIRSLWVVGTRPQVLMRVEGPDGLRFDVDPSRSGSEAAMWRLGAYELGTLSVLRRLIAPSSIFLDVGAHFGLMSLVGWKAGARTTAFEPHPGRARVLAHNVELNSADVDVRQAGLGPAPATMSVSDRGVPSEGGVVPVTTVDDVVADLGGVDVMKVDVEGWEAGVLKGAHRTLRVHRPALVVESSVRQGGKSERIYDLVSSAGYQVFRMRGGKDAGGPLREVTSGVRMPCHDNVVCLPR